MSTLRTAGLELANFLLTTKEGRELVGKGKDYAVRGIKKTGEALSGLGEKSEAIAGPATLDAALGARDFASKFADKKGLFGAAAKAVGGITDDQILNSAEAIGRVANPVSKGVAVLGTGALVGGMLTKPDTAYSLPMQQLAAREAAEYGVVDAKLAADAERQLGNSRLAEQKFQQALFIQDQRQQHEIMMAGARREARTPMNQPGSSGGLDAGVADALSQSRSYRSSMFTPTTYG